MTLADSFTMGTIGSMDTKQKLLTTSEVAALYGVQRRTVTMWIRRGHLIPSVTWGQFGITQSDLDAFEGRRRSRAGKRGFIHPLAALRQVNARTGKKVQKK